MEIDRRSSSRLIKRDESASMLIDRLLLNLNRIITVLNMVLEDKDIIQVDATVSAGVLIFLTITNITGITKGHPAQLFGALVVLFPFSISAILVGFENLKQGKRYENYQFKGFALVFMMGGFIYLIAIVLVFYIISGNVK